MSTTIWENSHFQASLQLHQKKPKTIGETKNLPPNRTVFSPQCQCIIPPSIVNPPSSNLKMEDDKDEILIQTSHIWSHYSTPPAVNTNACVWSWFWPRIHMAHHLSFVHLFNRRRSMPCGIHGPSWNRNHILDTRSWGNIGLSTMGILVSHLLIQNLLKVLWI